jgi:hypothetical protein
MGRRVYLHIGTMKSATSYLAQLCELNSEHLLAANLLWPSNGLRYHAIRDFFGREVKDQDFTGCWQVLLAKTREYPGDVLLSNEMLAALTVRQVRRLCRALAPAELHVIVTARDLARVVPSHWQTTLKNGRTDAWRDFASAVCGEPPSGRGLPAGEEALADEALEEEEDEGTATVDNTYSWFWRRHDVAAILERWQQVVPAERTTLVTVPPSGTDPELVARRFGTAIGVELGGLAQPEWSNRSVGAYSAELLRRLNVQLAGLPTIQRSYGFKGGLAESLIFTRADAEPRFALTQEQQDRVRARAGTMMEQIAQLEVRVVGDLSDLMPPEHPPAGCVDPSEATDAEVLSAASHGLAGMIKAVTELRVDRRELAAEVAALQAARAELEDQVDRQRRRILTLVGDGTTIGAGGASSADPGRLTGFSAHRTGIGPRLSTGFGRAWSRLRGRPTTPADLDAKPAQR